MSFGNLWKVITMNYKYQSSNLTYVVPRLLLPSHEVLIITLLEAGHEISTYHRICNHVMYKTMRGRCHRLINLTRKFTSAASHYAYSISSAYVTTHSFGSLLFA